jgi:phosphohistidine phosphatase SixA
LRRVIWAGLLACVFAVAADPPLEAQTATANDVWALLNKPGHIILLRHSNAPGSVLEPDKDFSDCSLQRNLDEAGRAQAARIGDEFRKHKIAHVKLLSSQYCRALDTAKLTKLGPVTPQPILNQVTYLQLEAMRNAGVQGRELMKKIPANQLTMLVTHVTNIQAIADVKLDSGEMAVVHFGPSGDVVVDGKIMVP